MLAVVTEYDEYSRVFLNGGTVLVVTSFYNLIGLVPLNMLSFIIYTALTLSAAGWTYVDRCLNRQSGLYGPILLTCKVD